MRGKTEWEWMIKKKEIRKEKKRNQID